MVVYARKKTDKSPSQQHISGIIINVAEKINRLLVD